ncbi:MAG: RDD family protein [Planctomycetota bacterium]
MTSQSRWDLFRRRVAAYVVDIAVLFLVLGPIGWFIQRALGIVPSSGLQIWTALIVNFSVPAWTYFALADASESGATIGKRWLRLRVVRYPIGRIAWSRALVRTTFKLMPWELVHVSVFALEETPETFCLAQGIGLSAANALVLIYLGCATITKGRRSVHDYAAGTTIQPA